MIKGMATAEDVINALKSEDPATRVFLSRDDEHYHEFCEVDSNEDYVILEEVLDLADVAAYERMVAEEKQPCIPGT